MGRRYRGSGRTNRQGPSQRQSQNQPPRQQQQPAKIQDDNPWEQNAEQDNTRNGPKPKLLLVKNDRVTRFIEAGVLHQTITLSRQDITYIGKQIKHRQDILKSVVNYTSGPAGTGKTFTALAVGAELMLNEDSPINRIHYVRMEQRAGGADSPATKGDEFLKFRRFLKPLGYSLTNIFGVAESTRIMSEIERTGKSNYKGYMISAGPVGDDRGVTYDRTMLIFDEASGANDTILDLEVGRIGIDSKIVILGDPLQNDVKTKPNLSAEFAKAAKAIICPILNFVKIKGIATAVENSLDNYIAVNSPPIVSDFERAFNNATTSKVPSLTATMYTSDDATVRNPELQAIKKEMFPHLYQ